MPILDDNELLMCRQSPYEIAHNNERLKDYKESKCITKKYIKNNISVELYKSRYDESYACFIVENYTNQRCVLGELTAYQDNFPFPNVGLVYVLSGYQGNGYSTYMYKTLINYTQGLISDETLTGKNDHGSINIWSSLSKYYHSYIISSHKQYNNYFVKEVGHINRLLANNPNNRFMITVNEF